jgi:hypothetical protein
MNRELPPNVTGRTAVVYVRQSTSVQVKEPLTQNGSASQLRVSAASASPTWPLRPGFRRSLSLPRCVRA